MSKLHPTRAEKTAPRMMRDTWAEVRETLRVRDALERAERVAASHEVSQEATRGHGSDAGTRTAEWSADRGDQAL